MRNGDWLQTYGCNQMFPLDPREDEICIDDIAHALSNICRFNGHTRRFYSVAEHCCHVADLMPSWSKFEGLMHDASEAYLCDLPRPLKRSQGFAEKYLGAEDRLMRVIAKKYGFQYPMSINVKDGDNRLLATEADQLMSPIHPEWKDHYDKVPNLLLPCWSPEEAKKEFYKRFEEYQKF